MKLISIYTLAALLSSCMKENINSVIMECIDHSIIPATNINNSRDLREYNIRDDSTLATSVKLVPNQGYIYWKANAEASLYRGRHGIIMRNYFDTLDWRNLDSWVNKRDLISLEYNDQVAVKQKLMDDKTHAKDSNTLRAVYFRSTADGDVFDADWEIDTGFDNDIEITKMDSQYVEGKFNLYFKLKHPSTIYNYAPTVQFRCGQFKAKKL